MINRTALFFIFAAFFVVVSSCTTTSIDVVPITPHEQQISRLLIGTITLESVYSYSTDQRELRNTIISVGKQHGFSIETTASDYPLLEANVIDFLLREKSYMEGFKTINSTAILAIIHDPDGNILYRVSFLHDGKESLTSLGYLRKAMDDMFNSMEKEIKPMESEEL